MPAEAGCENVLITLGTAGAAFGNEREFYLIPTLDDIAAVDPTGAGDSFVGAFSTLCRWASIIKRRYECPIMWDRSQFPRWARAAVAALTGTGTGADPGTWGMELLLPEEDGSRCG